MRIDELDEYQGLEAQMVRDWMISRGCVRQDGYWRHPREQYHYTDGEYGGLLWEDTLFKLSVDFELASVQALLREINPRMRQGMPSQAALADHGHWLVRDTETGEVELHRVEDGHLYSMSVYRGGVRTPDANALPDFGTWMEFWPCDEHGNKVRWPERDGVML
jgi:hypothetical protein